MSSGLGDEVFGRCKVRGDIAAGGVVVAWVGYVADR
jgi:hypothetical protein